MASIFKLPDVWRLIRELDLESVKRDAESRFRLVVLADSAPEAEALAVVLGGDDVPHPWIDVRTPALLAPGADDRATITAVLLVTASAALSPALALAVERLAEAQVPLLTVVYGSGRESDGLARRGEAARVRVTTLGEAAVSVVGPALVQAVPAGLRLALARQLPPLRPAVFDLLIDETARANATYAFTAGVAEVVPLLDVPLNIADTLILTKNQLLMGYKIALGAGKSGRARDLVGEVLGVIGGGFLFRQAARQLVGLVPVAGIVPKVVIAYTGTWAIGRAVVAWATEGRRLSRAALGRLSRDAAARGRTFARGLIGQRRGSAAAK